jgi:hypothetical protein
MILNVTFLPGRLVAPVVVVAHEVDAIAGRVLDELVAAAADRRLAAVEVFGRRAGRDLLRHDVDRRQVVRRERIRRRVLEADRVGVDDLLRDDRLGVGRERTGAVRHVRHAIDREHDVLGVSSEPSVNLTPLRSLNSHVVGSIAFHEVARPGISFESASIWTSLSKRCSAALLLGNRLKKCGSIDVMSAATAILNSCAAAPVGRNDTVSARTTAQADKA